MKDALAADDFCLKQFQATETAFRSVLVLFNLLAEIQRATGAAEYRRLATLRLHLFVYGASLGRYGRRFGLHLALNWGGLKLRKPLIDSILYWPVPTSPKLNLVTRS